jgi:hypothetical protein
MSAMDCPELVNQDLRYRSFLIQSKRVNIVASNIAKQQRCVCWVEPHIRPPPSRIMPVLQICNLLFRPTADADSKQAQIAPRAPEINELAIP